MPGSINSIQGHSHDAYYQAGAPSAMHEENRKIAHSLEEALSNWHNEDEIKYHQGAHGQSSFYYSDSQQPKTLLENGQRFIARLTKPEERELHRQGIFAVIKNLKDHAAFSVKGVAVENDFALRIKLGQPLSIGQLKESFRNLEQKISPADTALKPCFSLFGKPQTGSVKKSTAQIVKDDLAKISTLLPNQGYQSIPDAHDDLTASQHNPLAPSPEHYQNGSRISDAAHTPKAEPKSPLKADDFPLIG